MDTKLPFLHFWRYDQLEYMTNLNLFHCGLMTCIVWADLNCNDMISIFSICCIWPGPTRWCSLFFCSSYFLWETFSYHSFRTWRPINIIIAVFLTQLKEGEKLISGSHDGSVKLWRPKQGKCLFTASNVHQDWVTCSAVANQSSQFFVTGSNDNLVVLWKVETSRIFPISK